MPTLAGQVVVSILTVLVGCRPEAAATGATPTPNAEGTPAQAPGSVRVVERIKLDLGNLVGISGLTTDDKGVLWAVPERNRYLVPLELGGDNPGVAGAPIPLVGVPAGLDTESIGWVQGQEFVLGTESQVGGRKLDRVLRVRIEGGQAKVFDEIILPYDRFGLAPRGNQGLEAICVVGDTIVVGLESVVEPRPPRWAHLFRASLTERIWEPFRVRLATDTGKLSALECRREGDELFAVGIERHYGIARLMSFRMPLSGKGGDLEPKMLADLAAQVRGVPNMEGIAWRRPGELVIVVDNDTGGVTGPNEAFIVTGPGL